MCEHCLFNLGLWSRGMNQLWASSRLVFWHSSVNLCFINSFHELLLPTPQLWSRDYSISALSLQPKVLGWHHIFYNAECQHRISHCVINGKATQMTSHRVEFLHPFQDPTIISKEIVRFVTQYSIKSVSVFVTKFSFLFQSELQTDLVCGKSKISR